MVEGLSIGYRLECAFQFRAIFSQNQNTYVHLRGFMDIKAIVPPSIKDVYAIGLADFKAAIYVRDLAIRMDYILVSAGICDTDSSSRNCKITTQARSERLGHTELKPSKN